MWKNFVLEPRGEWFELADERIGLCATIDMHQGQELAGGRTIGSPVKPLRIGPCAPTRSSAVPSIGQRVAPRPKAAPAEIAQLRLQKS